LSRNNSGGSATIVSIPLGTHKIKGTRHLILIIATSEQQMDTIDLEDELKDAKILTPWLSV
jgi:hypothetical protein